MEKYVYYSIAIFSGLIFFLYVYLLFEKLSTSYGLKKVKKYEKTFVPYLEELFIKLEKEYPEPKVVEELKNRLKNKTQRKIMLNKAVHFISLFKGTLRINLIKLFEDTGLVKYEIENLKTKDLMKLNLICKNLGELRSKTAVAHLINVLEMESVNVQYNALMAIAKIGDVDSFITGFSKLRYDSMLSERSLIEIVDSFEGDKTELYNKMVTYDNDNTFAAIIIKSAGNYLEVSFNDEISKFIKDDNLDKKLAAIKVIGQTVDVRFLEDIIESLKDENWQVRAVAAKALGRLEDPKALPWLAEALSDREWWVRYNSAQAIFEMSQGIRVVETVFSGNDNFAKDILINAMETSGAFADLYLYGYSTDVNKRNLAEMVMNYINKIDIGDKKDEA